MTKTSEHTNSSKRRRNNMGVWFVGFLAFAGAASAVAFGPGRHHGPHGDGHFGRGLFSDRMVSRVLDEVEATDTQRTEIEAVLENARTDLNALRGKRGERGEDKREAVAALLTGSSIDRAALDSMRVAKLERMNAASERMLDAAVQVAEILEPEQRLVLAAHFEKRAERHRERRAERRERRLEDTDEN